MVENKKLKEIQKKNKNVENEIEFLKASFKRTKVKLKDKDIYEDSRCLY